MQIIKSDAVYVFRVLIFLNFSIHVTLFVFYHFLATYKIVPYSHYLLYSLNNFFIVHDYLLSCYETHSRHSMQFSSWLIGKGHGWRNCIECTVSFCVCATSQGSSRKYIEYIIFCYYAQFGAYDVQIIVM